MNRTVILPERITSTRRRSAQVSSTTGTYGLFRSGDIRADFELVLVAPLLVVFHVAAGRGRPVLQRLIGMFYAGILSSDRLAAYNGHPADRRQLCWSHLLRNLLALSEHLRTRNSIWAADMIAQVQILFALWHCFRADQIDRAMLQAAMALVQATMRLLIEREAPAWTRGGPQSRTAAALARVMDLRHGRWRRTDQ